MPLRSVFFSDCFGVFQGGGARAAALAGAYSEACESGVRLSAVAGTSAGSIAAVLVAAGASPEFMENALRDLDFLSLLKPPDRHSEFSRLGPRIIGMVSRPLGWFSSPWEMASKVMRYGGCYSSRGIEEWVEAQLRKLLPNAKSPITFDDLRIPTFVVATNLRTQSAKVWSTRESRQDSVALAVRASCSIPMFFQPVLVGDSRLVDGGVLSNLPAFVFESEQHAGKRVLAFRLLGSGTPTSEWGPKEMASQLIDTVVSGAAQLQVGILRSVSCIDIRTDGVLATDFHKMNKEVLDRLIDGGREAVKSFFASEVTRIGSPELPKKPLYDRDQLYLAVIRQSSTLPDEVLIVERDSEWYWKIFPTVLYWRTRRVKVRVLLMPAPATGPDADKERFRRNSMRRIGVTLQESETLPLQGYVFRRDAQGANAAILFLPNSTHSPFAELYEGVTQQQVVRLIYKELIGQFHGDDSSALSFVPTVIPAGNDELCHALKRGVLQYSNPAVTVSVEQVTVAQLRTITKLVRSYKYEQMTRLVELFEEGRIDPFAPVKVTLSDGGTSLMCPPVFEIHGDGLHIGVEGNTRTLYALRHGLESMTAVVVRGVTAPLPGRSVSVQEVSLIEFAEKPATTMPGFAYENFRRIEGACHPHRS